MKFEVNVKGDLVSSASLWEKHFPELRIPDGTEVVGKSGFSECGITIDRLVIPPSVKRIKEKAFSDCAIKELIIEDGDVPLAIDGSSFAYNELEELVLPKRVWYVGKQSFSYCSQLKDLKDGIGLRIIYTEAFMQTSIKSLGFEKFAPFVTTIKAKAFSGCGLQTLRFPSPMYTPVEISEDAFEGNDIEEVRIRADTFVESDLEVFEGIKNARKIIN